MDQGHRKSAAAGPATAHTHRVKCKDLVRVEWSPAALAAGPAVQVTLAAIAVGKLGPVPVLAASASGERSRVLAVKAAAEAATTFAAVPTEGQATAQIMQGTGTIAALMAGPSPIEARAAVDSKPAAW